jgi:hypothetical protein
MTRYILAGLVLLLAACSSSSDTQSSFYKAEAGYTAILQAAASYTDLPRCEAPAAPKVCSKQAVVDQIRPAANSAQATVLAAEDTIRKHPEVDASFAVAAAQNAAQALSAILAQYSIPTGGQ